ncbi:aromatic ring-hydroxylating dioxygenase subunit alpha [Burkholderia gladioli pv. gladioli]|uniref:Aromatic ring-hydroxylating dioxygenase subunit alpha n=1 Tax=Burkholderia gladioli TaxID=28095 RepID=A0AB38U5K9_BURGA|nr:aromatic ring-hydroxylating dioxygenase subunit alpha [Burkholderia gladioli]MBU9272451.1 aromatic ring-hydroxylating dioxygenase subunit alpha [Burkholderia gladioli]MDJ1167162.1 aromatic ring-hydroxylating dioxygenase subunit alpha [Burkholderia gladioli pv. gladioli]MDN7716695.1 aromatic ring-hydroxylating dioxygenase subunit alpha [Burkholderia gladioli]MDN7808068.1 aromatic ring-hydroxylating dioxygenase subunit alpha [Burkholderia gladioli]UWX75225.1 aromatic ring-hydroxylating dioxyg
MPIKLARRASVAWPEEGLTRVPYQVFQDEAVYADEQEAIFRGPNWSFLCLETEVPNPGDFRSTFVGDAPVVVTRDTDGELYAFENRCAHRGALVCLEDQGNARDFSCVYHAWTYNLQGDLVGVAFKDGIDGKGGMKPDFCTGDHGLRKLRVATLHGLVFGSFSDDVAPLDEYLGEEIVERIARVLDNRSPVVLGRFTQMLPNNWKLYFENVKDSYHASILHLFFTTFQLNRLSQRGGIIVDPSGGHHVSYSAVDHAAAAEAAQAQPAGNDYAEQNIRSESEHRLEDTSVLQGVDEFGDGVTLQILSVFPGFVLQQIQNAIAVRQILPRGTRQTELNWTYLGFEDDTPELREMRLRQSNLVGPAGYVSMEDGCVGGFVQRGIEGASECRSVLEMGGDDAESSSSRVTEASIRGFWKAYRNAMGY